MSSSEEDPNGFVSVDGDQEDFLPAWPGKYLILNILIFYLS